MKITIVAVGKIKEKFFAQAIDEYKKRLSRYCNVEIVEVPDEKAPESMSEKQEEKVKLVEGERILKNIKEGFIVALAIEGKQLASEELAKLIEEKKTGGVSHITFIIGGSLGLSKEVLERADMLLSFSKMTFPHMLMRVILLEQIYRAHKISAGEPYHK